VTSGWVLSEDVGEFLDATGDFLRAQRVQHTVQLTVSETLRVRGPGMFGAEPPLFGWWSAGGEVAGAFLECPPYPLLLSAMPHDALAPLAEVLSKRTRGPSGVNASEEAATAFAGLWTGLTGARPEPRWRQRLYRLDALIPLDPPPPGQAVVAGTEHRDLLLEWYAAFGEEIGETGDIANSVDDRLDFGGFTLWVVDGLPVAMAGITRQVAGMVRVAPVYTPSEQRRQGFGGAATAAVSQGALDAGAEEVLLFTDLANPTTNRIYQQLGFQPVEDRVVLLFRA
jgi:hypothetical protein